MRIGRREYHFLFPWAWKDGRGKDHLGEEMKTGSMERPWGGGGLMDDFMEEWDDGSQGKGEVTMRRRVDWQNQKR